MAWQNPKTDWVTNPKNPDETDFNRIEGNIAYLIDELDTKLPVGNADPSDVLQGKTFSKTGAIGLTGTMPDNGSQDATLVITGASKPSKVVPAGKTSGGTITAELDTTLAQYILNTQTIGGVQGTLIQGRQVASDTGSLTQVNAYTAQLVVTGLAFTPTELYLRGSVRARYSDSVFYGSPSSNYMTVNYAIYNNTIVPQSRNSGLYIIADSNGQVNNIDVITITASVTFQTNGFTVVFTQTSPSTRGLDQYGTQYWTAIE
jgi:hypothetical protein